MPGIDHADAATATNPEPRNEEQEPIYRVETDVVDGEFRAVYTHDRTGFRVVCRQPADLWHVELQAPLAMGASTMFRIGFDSSADAARERAEAWMDDHPTGVPETAPQQLMAARLNGELPRGDAA